MAFINRDKLPKNTVKRYTGIESKWEWNQSTERFEEIKDYDRQIDIDEYQGMDLKSMLEKNIVPQSDESKCTYMDTTVFGNFGKTKRALECANQYEFVEDNEGNVSVEAVNPNVQEKQDDGVVDEPKDNGKE